MQLTLDLKRVRITVIKLRTSSIISKKNCMDIRSDDYHEHRNELDQIVDSYHEHFANKYNAMEETLLKELHDKSQLIKHEIANLTMMTSEEAIERLIFTKKQQKQGERVQLQKMWRGLTKNLKKMEEAEKQITNQNKEYEFDIRSITEKISQLQKENEYLSGVVSKLKSNQDSDAFLTQYKNQKSKTCLSGVNYPHHPKGKPIKNMNKGNQNRKLALKIEPIKDKSNEDFLFELLQKDGVKKRIYYILHPDNSKPIR